MPQLPFPIEPVAALRANFRQSIREICAHAAPRGITILLEPLNTYEGIPGVLTTLYEAVNYVDELGLDNLGVQPDVYHMNIEEGSIPDALRYAGPRIRHFHLNETNHCQHGTGHGDFQEIFRILKGIGYDGYLCTYMPKTTQAILQSTPGNPFLPEGTATGGGARPDLAEVLGGLLGFLRETERTVDQSREFLRGRRLAELTRSEQMANHVGMIDSTALLADATGLRERMGSDGYLFLPRLVAAERARWRSSATSWHRCGSTTSSRMTAPRSRCGAGDRSPRRGNTWHSTSVSWSWTRFSIWPGLRK